MRTEKATAESENSWHVEGYAFSTDNSGEFSDDGSVSPSAPILFCNNKAVYLSGLPQEVPFVYQDFPLPHNIDYLIFHAIIV